MEFYRTLKLIVGSSYTFTLKYVKPAITIDRAKIVHSELTIIGKSSDK